MDIHVNAIEYIVFMFNMICQSWGVGYICQLKPTFEKKTFRNLFLILGGGYTCQLKTEIYLPKDFSILGGYICQLKSIYTYVYIYILI